MKKVSSFVVFLLLGLTALMAKPVDAVTARKVADQFFRSCGLYDKSQPNRAMLDITATTPFSELYVFTTTATRSGHGFVIVAGDDLSRPILGYSGNSAFVGEGIPAHVLSWLQGYEREIQTAREQGYTAPAAVASEWQFLTEGSQRRETSTVVAALLSTTWNQSPYYNQLCPYDSEEGEYSLTGCVATATGQLMKYWNHPATGMGSHSYTSNYGQLTVNFAGTTYDWNNMPAALTSSSTAAQKTAVATLLYHCGVAVEMDYSPSGSGSFTIGTNYPSAELALKNYFRYSDSLYGCYKSSYTDAAWKQLMMDELDARRPMIYRGQGSSGGHSFVCDGYDSDTAFHFNFGWSGYYDGFYPLSAISPTSSMGFSTDQGAIIGIRPNGSSLSPRTVSVSAIQTQTATVSWTDPSSSAASGYQTVYGLASVFDTANASTYTLVNSTQPSCLLTGLTPYTAYKVAVRGLRSSDTTAWSQIADFTTAALPQTLPQTAGFESGTLPTYWSQEYVSGNTNWQFNYTGSDGHPISVAAGTYAARLCQYGSGAITRLITPTLNIVGDASHEYTGNVVAKVSFAHSHESWYGDQDELNVYYRASATAPWTLLANYSASVAGWQYDTLTLPNVSGAYQIAFEAESHYGYGVSLDDIRIYAEHSATSYATVPYNCDFADTTETNRWVLLNGSDTNRWCVGMGTASGYADPYSLYVSSDNGMSNYYVTTVASTVFAYRDITLNTGQYAYRYDWTCNGESGRDFMRVALVPENVSLTPGVIGSWGVGTLPAGALALDGGSLLNGQSSWQMQDGIINVPATSNYRIVVLWHNDDRYGYQPPAAIDNLIFRQNSCVLPTSLTASNITNSSAVLTWTAGGSESGWLVTVGSQTHYTSTPAYTLTGLSSNTQYTAEVRSVCSGDTSLVPRRLTFRTECSAAVMPYNYGFEDAPVGAGSAMPDCWHRISTTNFPYVVQSNAHTGSRTLYFYNINTQYAVLPSVAEPINSLKMKLWVRKVTNTPVTMVAGIMSDPNDAATFVPVDTLEGITSAYSRFTVSYEGYSGTANYPALKVPAGTTNYLYVDDVSMTTCNYEITDSVPFVETFESSSATRGCWTQENEVGNIAWTYNNGGHSSHPASAHDGTANALLYGSSRGSQTRLISPVINAGSLSAVKLSFWHAQAVWGSDQDELDVYYRTGSDQPWVLLESLTSNTASWTLRQYYLPNSDSLQVSFLGETNYGWGICIDDVTIESSPYCGSVSDLTATLVDTMRTSVRLNWTGSLVTGSHYRLQYGVHGFDTAHAGTTVNNIANTTYTIPRLDINTTYDFYVTTICNSQQESQPVMVSAYIPSTPVQTFPYSCSFDSVPENNQWVLVNGSQANQWVIGTAVGNDAANPRSIYISNDNGANNAYTINAGSVAAFAYREVVLPVGAYNYGYHWHGYGESTYDYLRVALVPASVSLVAGSTSGWSYSTLPQGAIALDGGQKLNLQSHWQTNQQGSFAIDSAGTYRLVLYWKNDASVGTQPPAAVDNISISQNDCGTVANPAAEGIDTNTIRLTWDGVLGTGATYTVEYGLQGFVRGTGTVVSNITARTTDISGLQVNTNYDFYVGINCTSQSVTPVLVTGSITSLPITLPYSTTFSGTRDNAFWMLTNGTQTNRWNIGTATGNGDSHSLYVSNSNGLDNAYSETASAVFAYRAVVLNADDYAYRYDWKANGENNYDYLRVALVPASVSLTAGTSTGWGYNQLPSGSYALDGGSQLRGQTGWQTVTGSVTVTQAGRYNLVFFWKNDGNVQNQPPAAIDNLMFREDNCAIPTSLAVSAVDSTSLTLTWATIPGGRWMVEYGLRRDTVTTNRLIATGLTPGTDYTFRVTQLCSDGTSFPAIITASTLCGARPLPYSYGFEDASGNGSGNTINHCWRMGPTNPNSSSVPYPTRLSHQGNYSFFTNTATTSGAYLVMPALAAPTNRLAISFYARRYSTSSSYRGNLRFGVVDNPGNLSSFQPFANVVIDSSTAWNQYTVYSDTYSGTTGYVCILAPQGISGYNDIFIDDITVEQMAECSGVNGVAATTTYNTAAISWHETGSATRWGVEYGTHGFSVGSGTFSLVSDTALTISGLSSSTEYDVYIYSDCAHSTSQPTLFTFTTQCGPVAVPFAENFDSCTASTGASIGTCWHKGTNSSYTQYPYPSTTYAQYSGSKSIYFNSSRFSYSYAALPQFSDTIQTLMMRLKVYKPTSQNSGNIQVGVMSDPTDISTFRLVQALQPSTADTWTSFSVSFANVTGSSLYIALLSPQTSSGYNDVYVDDVEVTRRPPCNSPTGLSATNITTSTATVSWNAVPGASYYHIEYGPEGFQSGISIDSISTIYQLLTGLQAGTTYEVRVSGLCNSGLGYSDYTSLTFTTSCGSASVPYTENFDSYTPTPSGSISVCWYKNSGGGSSSNYPYPTAANPLYTGSNSLYFQGGNSSRSYSYAALPQFSENIQSLQMTLKVLKTSAAGTLTVGVMSDAYSYSTFVPVDTIVPSATNTWQTFTVDFSGVTMTSPRICLAARAGANSTYYVQVDDVVVDTIATCATVANLRVDSLAHDAVRIRWNSVPAAIGYQVEYGPAGFPIGYGNILQTTNTYADISGLSAATGYTVYVRSKCSATNLGAAAGLNFQTDCQLLSVPYTYGFEDASGTTASATINPCWRVLSNSSSYPRPASNIKYEGSYGYMLYSNTNYYSCVVLPKFADSVQNLQLSLRLYRQNTQGGRLSVGVMTDPDDFTTFRSVQNIQISTTGSWQLATVNLSNTTGRDLWIAIAAPRGTQNITYIDNIEVNPYTPFRVNLHVMDSTRGTVRALGNATADGRFYPNTVVTLAATPAYGYVFGHWAAGITSNPYTFTMPANDVYFNNIVFNKRQFAVAANTSNPAFGTTRGSGSYDYLDTATLTAVPLQDCAFYQWSDGDTTNPRQIVVTRDTALTAVFGHGCPETFESDTAAACESYIWAANGVTYTTSGIKLYTHQNAYHCTLVDTLYLTVNHATSGIDTQTACDSLVWHGSTYTASTNTPTDTLVNAAGCDSVVTLHLTVHHSVATSQIANECDTFLWNGRRYTQDTVATATLATTAGCDSVVTLRLTIRHSTAATETDTACDSFEWYGTTYTASTTATHTLVNAAGCDSVVTLRLTINRSAHTRVDTAACDSLVWHGRTLTLAGDYSDTLATATGCDSIVTLSLTLYHSQTTILAAEGCNSYIWQDSTYTESGTYQKTLTSAHGCDSTLTLNLTIYNSVATSETAEGCESYLWHGRAYTASGTYRDTLATVHGCDSIVTLNLQIYHSQQASETAENCDSLVWHGRTYTASGTYCDTLATVHGCDSIVTLGLTLYPSRLTELTQTACDTFLWRGVPFTRSGSYSVHLATVHGCDSAVTLHLTVNRSFHAEEQDTACDNYFWPASGQTYTESSDYRLDTLTAEGCDSIRTLHLVVNHAQTVLLDDTTCDSYEWHGTAYTHSGTYSFDSLTAEGCDYREQLALTVNSSTHAVEYRTACDTFYWHGQALAATGTYTHDYVNASGCASTDTLHLTIDHHSDTAFHVTTCDSYSWNDSLFTESGVYIYDYRTQSSSCTNVDTLYLTINRSSQTVEQEVRCDGFDWNGRYLTESGTYYLDSLTAAGCDSTVRLDLTINHSSAEYLTAEACDEYQWDDSTLTESGTYIRYLTNAAGCDSILTLTLTVHPSYMTYSPDTLTPVQACDSLLWNSRWLTASGLYSDTLSSAYGCDSLAVLLLDVRHSIRRTDTVTACNSFTWIDSITYNASTDQPVVASLTADGCDSVISLNLTVNYSTYNVQYQNYCDTFTWHGQQYAESGTYYVDYLNEFGCASSDTLHLTITSGTDTAYHVTACDRYSWNDSLYTESGIYLFDYSAIGSECTNVDTLYLTINRSNAALDSLVACDSLIWIDGQTYRTSTYGQTYTLTNAAGCDSVVTLSLTLHYNTSAAFYDTISEGEEYVWSRNGQTYTETGTYLYDYTSDEGCASTDTLHLHVIPHYDTAYYTVRGWADDTLKGYVVIHPDTLLAEYETAIVIAVPHEGYHFSHWNDGDTHVVRLVVMTQDTSFVAHFEASLGISEADAVSFTVWSERGQIHVAGSHLVGQPVAVYDMQGRVRQRQTGTADRMDFDAANWPTGVYFVRVGSHPAQRVVLCR